MFFMAQKWFSASLSNEEAMRQEFKIKEVNTMTELHDRSESELQELLDHAAKILKEKQDTRRREAITQIQEIAGAAGITVTIKEERKRKNDPLSANEKVYQHPDKSDVTWDGNGAIPKWLKDFIKSGRDKAEFELIHPAS